MKKKVICCLLALWSAVTAAGAASLDERGFVHDWMLLGPFPSCLVNENYDGLNKDFLADIGGEKACVPSAGKSFSVEFPADEAKLIAGIGSTNEWGLTESRIITISWEKYHLSSEECKVRLDRRNEIFDDHIVTYAVAYVESPIERQVSVQIGSDDDFRVLLNGKCIGESASSQDIVPGQFVYEGTLREGLNQILFKCVDRTQGYGFCLALCGKDGEALTDLNVYDEDPRVAVQNEYGLDAAPQSFCRGNWVYFEAPEQKTFKGKVPFRFLLGHTGNDAGSFSGRIMENKRQIATFSSKIVRKDEPVWIEENLELRQGRFTCILEGEGVSLIYDFIVYDRNDVKNKKEELRAKITEISQEIATLESENKELEAEIETLKKAYRDDLVAREDSLREIHDKNAAAAPRSLNEPLQEAGPAEREIIRLNGDMWKISLDGEEWKSVRLPRFSVDKFYRTWYYPVERLDPNKPYGLVRALPGLTDYVFDDSLTWKEFRVATELEGLAPDRRYFFRCDALNGWAEFFWNGRSCGIYDGNVGVVRIPLPDVQNGLNRLEIHYRSPDVVHGIKEPEALVTKWFGITGNMALESAASTVMTNFVDVSADWLKCTLRVSSEVQNTGKEAADIRLERYCVLDGTIRFRLPSADGCIEPGETLVFDDEQSWADPEWWGIGGKYGNPVLYTMVSDIYQNDTLVDRHAQTFGCRDFRIIGEAFYLNGRYIMLQGDVGGGEHIEVEKADEIIFSLLRKDNINIVRNHDGYFASSDFLNVCDHIGMLAYANMYPILFLNRPDKDTPIVPYDEWLESPLHQMNLKNYEAWVRMLRCHPSVVILSTDNEIWTQAWDTPEKREVNIRNDRLGAFYEQHVKGLAPDFIVTRDGDVGTWGNHPHFREDPPSDAANYHYPEFNFNNLIVNWQSRFGFRPLILGETLYYAYGAWDNWCGALPDKVAAKAAKIRDFASRYQDLAVPGQIYMGDTMDGFICFLEDGSGNPWGVTGAQHRDHSLPGYPWRRVAWPSQTGRGIQPDFVRCDVRRSGCDTINWFDPQYVSHVRNAVNDAFRETLSPMPELAPREMGECIVTGLPAGAILRYRPQNAPLCSEAVRADSHGTAWIRANEPGVFLLNCEQNMMKVEIQSRKEYDDLPGFSHIQRIEWSRE